LAPDVFLQLGTPGPEITSWKTWERGPVDLAIEISSRSDAPDEPWASKLKRYHGLGVRELLRFDHTSEQRPLRLWDYVEGDLVERKLRGVTARSRVLGLWWVVVPKQQWGPLLRLAHDEAGTQLLPTAIEVEIQARQAEAEACKAEAEARRAA